jgi:hypothetical protein
MIRIKFVRNIFKFQMPYNSKEIALNMSSFFTRKLYNFETVWSLDFDPNQTPKENDDNFITDSLKIKLTRKYKNYLLTEPTYIVYILSLLMFVLLLPQKSNQRIINGLLFFIFLPKEDPAFSAGIRLIFKCKKALYTSN